MWFGVHHAAKVMLAQAKTNTESAEAAVPRPKLPKVSEPKALSVSCVAFCHVCVFADEKVAELVTKIDMTIFVWLQDAPSNLIIRKTTSFFVAVGSGCGLTFHGT